MSARSRAEPWFRAPGERLRVAVAQYEWSRQRDRPPLFMGGQIVVEQRFYFTNLCEQCLRGGDDVRERVGVQEVNGMLYVQGVIRLRAMLCDRCARLLQQ